MTCASRAKAAPFFVLPLAVALAAIACGGADSSSGSPAADDPKGGGGNGSAFGNNDASTSEEPGFDASFEDAASPNDGGVVGDGSGTNTCLDSNDIGGTPAAAAAQADMNDGDATLRELSSTLNGAADVDIFKYKLLDTSSVGLNAYVISSTPGIEICAFSQCVNDPTNTNFKGCKKGTEVKGTGPNGMSGCCATSPGDVEVDVGCSTLGLGDDSQYIYMRVRQAADQCVKYKVGYHG